MGDYHWKELGLFLAFAATVFIAYGVMMSPPGTLCPLGSPDCFRDWVGALSGWVAAIGALLAAILTIPYLRRQAAEARKQSDYLVGDADPDFVLMRNSKRGLRLEVINWNRRNVVMEEIRLIDEPSFEIYSLVAVDPDVEVLPGKKRIPSFRIYGWKDRREPVPIRKFQMFLSEDGIPLAPRDAVRRPVRISIRYRVVGQIHERRIAYATTISADV